mgnify:CR=1 FL=1
MKNEAAKAGMLPLPPLFPPFPRPNPSLSAFIRVPTFLRIRHSAIADDLTARAAGVARVGIGQQVWPPVAHFGNAHQRQDRQNPARLAAVGRRAVTRGQGLEQGMSVFTASW